MKRKHIFFVLTGLALLVSFGFTACNVEPKTEYITAAANKFAPLTIKGTAGARAVEIVISSNRVADDTADTLFPSSGDSYILFIDDIEISRGTIFVSQGAILFTGGQDIFTGTINDNAHIALDSLPNGSGGYITDAFTTTGVQGGNNMPSGQVMVIFDPGIGTLATTAVTITQGAEVQNPGAPTFTPSGAYSRFRGWYTDRTYKTAFNFSQSVMESITIFADYGYRPGDTGPGTGTVFYRDNAGFTVPMKGSAADYTAYYLEAAPNDEARAVFTRDTANFTNAHLFQHQVGGGRWNSDYLGATSSSDGGGLNLSTPAATCRALNYGGMQDWYLPSRYELLWLSINREDVPGLSLTGVTGYWSSSLYDYQFVWSCLFSDGIATTLMRANLINVRAIRNF